MEKFATSLLLLAASVMLALIVGNQSNPAAATTAASGTVVAAAVDAESNDFIATAPGRQDLRPSLSLGKGQDLAYRLSMLFFISPDCWFNPHQAPDLEELTRIVPDCWFVSKLLSHSSE